MSNFIPYHFNPTKYRSEAATYSGSVSSVIGSLNSAMTSLNKVNSEIGFDTKGSNDLLSFNVISSNEEIKSEITNLESDLNKYSSFITTKAVELDAEAKRKFDADVARMRKLNAENDNSNNS